MVKLIGLALKGGPNWEIVNKFLYYLKNEYLIKANKDKLSKDEIENIKSAIFQYI
ncbi:MAG: hypothetical protein ACOC1K_03780 [Nanoarchaeota archaeon]